LQQRWQRLIETPPPQRPSAPAARRPIGELLVERLEHRRRKLLRHAAAAAAPRHLHRLRISGKKLRYLLEAFAPLLDRRRLTPLRRRLKAVQDDLGRWHDLEIQLQLLHRIAGEHDLHRPAAALHRHLGDALAASRRRLEDSLPALVRALEGSHPASLLAPAASG
ncbi:MAG: CHAD domain-containing protein, partial [Acidobacteria bacterium]